MATILDDEDTVEAQSLSTSLDPYGQLMKMLMPRALCIGIYDHLATPLWLSDGCEGPDLPQVVEEALNAARSPDPDPSERDGFARSWDGETAYVFILREGAHLLGAVALSCRDGSGGARPFSLMVGLLRPALQVLTRELVNQNPVEETPQSAPLRDGDLALLLDSNGAAEEGESDDFTQLVRSCVDHLDCAAGALFVPEKKIAATVFATAQRRADAELLDRTQRHLFAWAQVQRRTLTLNKAPPNSPLGTLPYKILACPIRHGAEPVSGILLLFRPHSAPDFELRQVRIVEMLARRIAYVLQNSYDPATGLLTRPAFERRALATLAQGPKDRHCVGYADVDRLHVINDNHGMHVGDQVLARIAETIRVNLPRSVIASRISGDRFALFLPDTPQQAAEEFFSSLVESIEQLDFRHEGQRIALSMSFGLAVVPETRLPLSHALATAEVACKSAKQRGRGRVELYQEPVPPAAAIETPPVAVPILETVAAVAPVLEGPRFEDATPAGDLREAIANDRFRMEAQSIVRLNSQEPARRFELLLRMIDASGESVSPDKFILSAERHGIASDIDRWVIQYALEILSSAAPALQGLGAHFAINLSSQSVSDENFPDFLEAKLREYELPPGLLSFEITETAAVANIVRAETLIRRVQGLGHGIALDDFGRGLSSLTYLKSLPVSDLKIDGALIRDLATGSRSQATVTAIVQLAQSMNLRTTAESIESEAILAAVGRLGVDYAQGFAIGRPRALEAVLQEILRGAPGVTRVSGSPLMARLAG
ncbi:MAG TPA: bifunctional diguanylate cyclase/phosphodiesterase [Povalibacter sp.]|uniref:bifunctional diguanylate cyclase/phosphodiesterase n=1 Tax=Povalibacter sp. TaxID=1962978 RepID=UPI002B6BDBD2|nr:bifunctional diguanylate cyclase/phosphodiesterase [Povalibacter sp.]HMN44729.1 bifunctional diguanylate cyclase/phosphodiesterase [Povalibacter sp.]